MEQILVCSGFVRASRVYEIEKLKTVVAPRVGGAATYGILAPAEAGRRSPLRCLAVFAVFLAGCRFGA